MNRGDGLRLQLTGVDVVSMRIVGTIPGIIVQAAAARNGVGTGILQAVGNVLTWTAPGSSTPGIAITCSVDGTYLLEDGIDKSKWLRVQVYNNFLAPSSSAQVFIADRYNELGPDDVSVANATAGQVETVEYQLLNVSGNTILNALLWIDPAVSGIQVSSDGVNFFAPTSSGDAHVLTWASIAVGASVNVWMKRTITAASASNPKILNILQYSWTGY